MQQEPVKVLLVADSAHDSNLLGEMLDGGGSQFELTRVRRVDEAFRLLKQAGVDVMLIDLGIPEFQEATWLGQVFRQAAEYPVIVLSDHDDRALALNLIRAGAQDFLVKRHLDREMLLRSLYFAIERKRAEASRQAWREGGPTIGPEIDPKLDSYAERLRILRNVDQSILSARSPEAIAKASLRHIQRLVPCQRGSIAVFDLETHTVTVFATHADRRMRRGTGTLVSMETFGDLDALLRGQVQMVGDLQRLADPSAYMQTLLSEGVRSYLRAPLIFKSELLGALCLEAYEANVFTQEHADIAREAADSLAVAIRQASLFEKIQHLAIIDDLTNLYNRRHFFELARRDYERARRYGGTLSAIMIDIDDFKAVNDTYGHAVGDQVLQVVAERLNSNVREADILGRYGGDEFVVLLPETDLIPAHQLAERLRHRIADEPVPTDLGPIKVTISVGVASNDVNVENVTNLIDLADADMYAAKQAG